MNKTANISEKFMKKDDIGMNYYILKINLGKK